MSNRMDFGTPLSAKDEDSRFIPLVVDLDGTLIRSDLLIESFFCLFAVKPLTLLHFPVWLAKGKAALKARIADHAVLDLHLLPMNEDLLAFIRAERERGRKVYLASASDRRYVQALADHLGLFDGVFGSDGATNLSGAEKARVLSAAFGEGGFDYAGNAQADMAVWEKARHAILVDAPPRLAAQARRRCPDLVEMAPPSTGWTGRLAAHARALRVHQWLKNLLVFLPILADHAWAPAVLGNGVVAFLAFCLCASSVYLLNDLIDLPNDRVHPTKRHRPFASGALPLSHGLVLIPLMLAGAVGLSALLPPAFLGVLAVYYGTTLLYSLVLKRRIVADVVALAGLYTLRVIAGAVATGITVSEWLLAFSIFLFLCLALVKRYSELVERRREDQARPAGRGYLTDDLPILGALAGASGFVSILVMALYINSPEVDLLYSRPDLLWGICLLLLYWISRILMLAHRGLVHDDPVVFAAKDPTSLAVVAAGGLLVIAGSL